MTDILKLIQERCPDGVEYRYIGNIADVGTGSSNGNQACDDGLYPFFIRSSIVRHKNDYEYDEEAIVIPGEGGVGDIYHYVDGKYALHQRVYRIHFNDDSICTKFVYYFMQAGFKDFILKKSCDGTVTSIRKPMIENFMVPVPPISVQQEIVNILDKLTELELELERELELRKKQYQWALNELMTFGGGQALSG